MSELGSGAGRVSFHEVPDGYQGQRLDNYLFARFRHIPKSYIYKALRKGEFRVNKKRAKPDYRLENGDLIRIPPAFSCDQQEKKNSAKLQPSKKWLEQLSQAVQYEDEKVIAINKPSGLAVHGGSGVDYGVIEVMQQLYPKLPQLELVHRLDRDTSGCLLLAKKRSALRELHQAFRSGQVQKSYYALTLGHWAKHEQRVDAPLRKIQLASTGERRVIVDKSEGKASLSQYETVKKFKDAELVLARPVTGRTHQLRVHAQYTKHPIAGDDKYGNKAFDAQMKSEFGLNRLFLHAYKIKLVLPSYAKPLVIEVPMSQALEECLSRLD